MKSITKLIPVLIALSVLSVCRVSGQADTSEMKGQKTDAPKRILKLFESDKPLDVNLEFDLKRFLEKPAVTETFDGMLTMVLSDADTIDRKVTLKYRGFSRYQNCGYAPVEVNFKKPVYLDNDSGRIKKIKLVHQCQRGGMYEEYIFREYLVYKLYNVLTDTSYRVRLLKINYIDSKKTRKPFSLYGFFIEPKTVLAQRTNSHVVKITSLTPKDMIPELMDKVALFNYMVSNWDWSIQGQHNIDVFKSARYGTSSLGIPVPFDYDLTGVVNAEYAIPPPELGIENNRVRIYRGMCRSREVTQKELLELLDKKDELYAVINEFPYLSKASKKDITIVLDQFFDQLEKPRSLDFLITTLLEKCKK